MDLSTQRCGGCARGLGLCIAPPTAAAPSGDKHQSQHLAGTQRCGGCARGLGLCIAPPTDVVLEDEVLHEAHAEDAGGLLLKPVEDVLGPPLHLTLAVSAY